MTSSMLRRQLKNLVQNYSEAEVKVREATSNDPWGPSSTQMADISDLTYNVVACNEIMTMLWKRLKDDRNWRHIHKSLTLLEYLLKTGDDRVLLKMKDNIYIVKALTEYRFVEKDGKDQGSNVREKAKVVLVLMEDDDKLKEERDFAKKTREKTSKGSAASSTDAVKDPNYKPCYVAGASGLPSLDNIPSVADLTASFAARKEERLKQEAEKKEMERRAKLSEDELKWEDAGKGGDSKDGAWGGEKAGEGEEVKTDAWGAPVEPKEATDPWGTPARPDTDDKEPSSDAWGAPSKSDEDPFAAPKTEEDPFAAPKTEEDPFAAPKNGEDPFAAPKDSSDPFSAPKDKEDPFAAPKGKPDAFSSSNSDPFNAPKDDPFNAPKDDPFNAPKDDPFNAPKDDPFSAPKDDPFTAPKDDPFTAPKDDPFSAPKDDPFNAPKDDPFNAPKDDPFNAPKDDPFNAPKDDPFSATKDDPFNTPKDDPFTAPASTPPKEDPFAAPASKDDPFTAPTTPPKEDPFSASTKPTKEDPFAAPTTPPKEDPFSAPSKPSKDDPFAAPTTPPKEDPFGVPSSPPKDEASDPFNAPPVSSPQGSADAWGAPASSSPTAGSDPWDAPSAPNETKGGDPWGDGTSATSPVDNSDGFGDSSKPDSDPWGTAAAPGGTDDAWGAPAAPSDSSPSSDPFGDGASKKGDPWGAPSSTPSNGTGKQAMQEKEIYRKTASFLGSAGASLVDLDDLFSSNPKPIQRPLINTSAAQTQAIGAFKARGMTSGLVVRSRAAAGVSFPETPAPQCSPFGSTLAPSFGTTSLTFGAAQAVPPCSGTGMVQSASVGGSPQMGFNITSYSRGDGTVQSGNLEGNPWADHLLGTQMGQSSFFGGNQQAGLAYLGGSTPHNRGIPLQPQLLSGSRLGETVNKNNNPFMF
ncbi:epsin-2-like [Acanthopagrus latus]|uniref:epsin-2-like n=1 Tax=Acanthopagrus latus TaxID=8177 RepID=UPI00187CEEB8|nr:epsin-2-like [Acanthopagrus latus]XP_036945270.1 epsin-2-like [Acanthopagrus latus]XP_036945275.1 epsin-2-like [Acanthopagrus latus]